MFFYEIHIRLSTQCSRKIEELRVKNTDTRVQYTKARFREAMLEMLEQKPIGFVTVRGLCDEAGLNRGTFYLHYSEPIDVLREMQEEVLSKTLAVIEERREELDAQEGIVLQLSVLQENRRLVRAVIGHNGDPTFLHKVRERAYVLMQNRLFRAKPEMGETERRQRFDFLFSGCTGVVTAWLNGENDATLEETEHLLSQLCESVIKSPI